jgi:hypothetical protein
MTFSQKKPVSSNFLRVRYGPNTRGEEDWSCRQVAMVIGAITATATVPGFFSVTAWAQTMFPDVPADYWAQPFIEALAQQGIVEGYPDGTFRPEEAIDRDEYAAVLWRAFEADMERTVASGSTFDDVPAGYWAAPAIEEAYEMGFMGLPDTNEFEPQAEVSRVEAISALVQGLELSETTPVAAAPASVETAPPPQVTPPQTTQRRRGTPFQLAIPMAGTELMKVFAPPAPAAASPQRVATVPDATITQATTAPGINLSQYYADADQIPAEVQDEVALATRLGLVVNYPDVQRLNPMEPISRGSTAALVHQALVHQDRLEPLPENSAAAPYVVEEDAGADN